MANKSPKLHIHISLTHQNKKERFDYQIQLEKRLHKTKHTHNVLVRLC